jgi:hypothetical protein
MFYIMMLILPVFHKAGKKNNIIFYLCVEA